MFTKATKDEGLSEKVLWSPADQLGFTKKCCFCVPLRPAAIIICILSFVWSAVELKGADQLVADVFPERIESIFYQILFYAYFASCICFALATSSLLVGIVANKYTLVNIYVWYAIFFNIAFVCLIVLSALSLKLQKGSIPRRKVLKSVVAIIWACLNCHFIVVINTFKYTSTVASLS